MKVTFMAEPDKKDLDYSRGDTAALRFQLVDENDAPINISGFSFVLTVDPEEDPEDTSNNLFQLVGVIIDAPTGVYEFAPTAVQSDQTPDEYHHDVQMIDGGGRIKTIQKGKFDLAQDITK